MVLFESEMTPLGSQAPDFTLPGIDGNMYTLEDFGEASLLVIIFLCNHCPYVQGIWEKLVALETEMQERNVQFVGINSNDAENYPEDSFEKMKEYADSYNMSFPYLFDETQDTAKEYGAVCTPDIFVYDQARKLVYRGRLDNAGPNAGTGTSEDLKDALTSILEGNGAPEVQYPSMGCSIKWKT